MAARLGIAFQETGHLFQYFQVLAHYLSHPRALDFHHHVLAVMGLGAVNLGQGGGGQGFRVETPEHFLDPPSQFLLQNPFHLVEREGGHLVLQLFQGSQIGFGDPGGLGGKQLPELDIGRTESLQVAGELLRFPGLDGVGSRRKIGNVPMHFFDKIGAAVLQEQGRDILIALQMTGCEHREGFLVNARRVLFPKLPS
jgi:hypothetical protein